MDNRIKQAVPIIRRGGDYLVRLVYSTGEGPELAANQMRIGIHFLAPKGLESHEIRWTLSGKLLSIEFVAFGGWQLFAGGFSVVISNPSPIDGFSYDVIPPAEE